MTPVSVGAEVRLTAAFLQSTGQYTGKDANGRWIVVACDCPLCVSRGFVAVNEPNLFFKEDPEQPKHRHFNVKNLEVAP